MVKGVLVIRGIVCLFLQSENKSVSGIKCVCACVWCMFIEGGILWCKDKDG